MKRIALFFSSTVAAVVLLLTHSPTAQVLAPITTVATGTTGTASTDAATGSTTSGTASSSTSSSSSSASGSTASGSTASSSTRTVTGDAVATRYGDVQVQIVVSGGKIVSATTVTYPSRGRDGEISNRSLPVLQSETVDAQSAQIDTVSGATFTSNGYIGSLQSAIDAAGL